jgi:antitoxin (DNA-binding transcriptional repressor) of toxin-antitoxin stability system
MKTEIGAYEATTHLPELLRQVKAGKRFTITHRGGERRRGNSSTSAGRNSANRATHQCRRRSSSIDGSTLSCRQEPPGRDVRCRIPMSMKTPSRASLEELISRSELYCRALREMLSVVLGLT